MRRAVLIRNAYEYDFGGAERFIVNFGVELQKNNWLPTILTAHKKIQAYAADKNVPVLNSPWLKHQDWSGKKILLFPFYVLWQAYMIIWYIIAFKKLQPDVVHAQSRDDFISATIAAKLLHIRIIWTDHADLKYVYQNVPIPLKNPVGKWVNRCSEYCSAITLVSKSEQSLVSKSLGVKSLPDQYTVVYNGITDFKPAPYHRAPKDKNAAVFCSTSRLVTAKGIGELIKAFKNLSKSNDNIRLWILGEGPEEAAFKKLADGNDNIIFFGFPENSYSILDSADIFVHPSYHEGFSLSIMEAALLAKPIIACNVGGNSEIIFDNKTGLLIPPRDAEALQKAMTKLLSSQRLRKSLGESARSLYERQFQFNNIVAKEFLPLYEK